MATTPNFNWATPDNTGLVKNGALDIRTLGDSIDSSMADLKGGTTGQVLKKATNTDMDFVWSADAAGMTNPMTTTGDTIYSSSGSTPARLGIGSTGQVLTVAAGVPSWATPAAGGGGKVLQVVQGTYSTSTTIASTTMTDTGLSLAITPTLSSSKILVLVNQQVEIERGSSNGIGCGVQLLRGATTVLTQAGSFASAAIEVGGATYVVFDNIVNFNYLDSPATTSSTTYKIQARVSTTANGGTMRAQSSSSTSIITLMEIGA
jgi:hypothetical protein